MSLFKRHYGGIKSVDDTDEIYFMGIIDILQSYNNQKKFETMFKSIISPKKKHDIRYHHNHNHYHHHHCRHYHYHYHYSCVHPIDYCDRFCKFILKNTDYNICDDVSSNNDNNDEIISAFI